MKYFYFALFSIVLNGCMAYKKEMLKNDYNHKIYITIENARIHNEAACVVGNRIQDLGYQYIYELEKLDKR